MGKKRQLDEVSIYTDKRVLKKPNTEHHAGYDSAVGSSSSPGPELDEAIAAMP